MSSRAGSASARRKRASPGCDRAPPLTTPSIGVNHRSSQRAPFPDSGRSQWQFPVTQSTETSPARTSTAGSQPAETPLNVDRAVRDRYSAAAAEQASALCCPVDYDSRLLEALPREILERDYGCGDPSRDVREGETVLDLGSGGGKICYIAAQIVGPQGRVVGVDCNDDMLALARKYESEMAGKLGYANVEFRKGRIQDLQLNLEQLDEHLAGRPPKTSSEWLRVDEYARQLRQTSPLVPDNSVDVVLSNCVLNLVRTEDRIRLFAEMFRVLKPGGRAVISDITSDEDVPLHLQNDPTLWSGCISGAFREDRFLQAFEQAGFYGIEMIDRQREPWAVVEGVEFRSLTVRAYKGSDDPGPEPPRRAVVYKGPWKAVVDEDGRELHRGQPVVLSDEAFSRFTSPPYAGQIEPLSAVPDGDRNLTILPEGDCCGPSGCC